MLIDIRLACSVITETDGFDKVDRFNKHHLHPIHSNRGTKSEQTRRKQKFRQEGEDHFFLDAYDTLCSYDETGIYDIYEFDFKIGAE